MPVPHSASELHWFLGAHSHTLQPLCMTTCGVNPQLHRVGQLVPLQSTQLPAAQIMPCPQSLWSLHKGRHSQLTQAPVMTLYGSVPAGQLEQVSSSVAHAMQTPLKQSSPPAQSLVSLQSTGSGGLGWPQSAPPSGQRERSSKWVGG